VHTLVKNTKKCNKVLCFADTLEVERKAVQFGGGKGGRARSGLVRNVNFL